jgi:hypothetical protein
MFQLQLHLDFWRKHRNEVHSTASHVEVHEYLLDWLNRRRIDDSRDFQAVGLSDKYSRMRRINVTTDIYARDAENSKQAPMPSNDISKFIHHY